MEKHLSYCNIGSPFTRRCGAAVRVIACIEEQGVIDRILAHLREKETKRPAPPILLPPSRAPPLTLSSPAIDVAQA